MNTATTNRKYQVCIRRNNSNKKTEKNKKKIKSHNARKRENIPGIRYHRVFAFIANYNDVLNVYLYKSM